MNSIRCKSEPPWSWKFKLTAVKGIWGFSVHCVCARSGPSTVRPSSWWARIKDALQRIADIHCQEIMKSSAMKVAWSAKAFKRIILQPPLNMDSRHSEQSQIGRFNPCPYWDSLVALVSRGLGEGLGSPRREFSLAFIAHCVPVCLPSTLGGSLQQQNCMFVAHNCNTPFMPCTPAIWHGWLSAMSQEGTVVDAEEIDNDGTGFLRVFFGPPSESTSHSGTLDSTATDSEARAGRCRVEPHMESASDIATSRRLHMHGQGNALQSRLAFLCPCRPWLQTHSKRRGKPNTRKPNSFCAIVFRKPSGSTSSGLQPCVLV